MRTAVTARSVLKAEGAPVKRPPTAPHARHFPSLRVIIAFACYTSPFPLKANPPPRGSRLGPLCQIRTLRSVNWRGLRFRETPIVGSQLTGRSREMPLRFGLYNTQAMDGFILPAWLGCLSEFAAMDFFLIPDRNSAPLQQSLLRSLQSYLNGIDPQESAAPPDAADNLAELYRIGKTMEGCVPVSDGETERASSCIAPFMAASAGSPGGETVCHVLNSVSSNLNTEATCVTTMALPDVAAWQLCGRQNASVTPTSSVSSSRGSSSPTIAAHCLAVNGGAAKVGKKRSRASRRAPTTLLNTDTSNFRAMVQQFTGISNAPFASSASNFSSADSPAHDSPPKPFAQRLLGQNFYAATTTNNSNPDNLFPPLAKFPPQHSSLPILPFQSLHAENMNSPFLLPNFFSNKGGAHGISEGQLISAMNAGPVLGPNPSTALSFGPT